MKLRSPADLQEKSSGYDEMARLRDKEHRRDRFEWIAGKFVQMRGSASRCYRTRGA